jgi:hypothetical protein
VGSPSGWRTKVCDPDRLGLLESVEHLVDPMTRGDPGSPLRWICKSTTRLADALTKQGRALSPTDGRPAPERGRVQPAKQPQDRGGRLAPGPQANAQWLHISRTV